MATRDSHAPSLTSLNGSDDGRSPSPRFGLLPPDSPAGAAGVSASAAAALSLESVRSLMGATLAPATPERKPALEKKKKPEGTPTSSAPSVDTTYIVALAQFLKDRADDLRPLGPTTSVFLNDEGPIGVHIAQAGPGRVVIVGTPPEFQAYKSGKIRFADQVLQIGSNSTHGLKMKQVKVLIADASRPVLIKLQPLCFAGEGRPIVAPEPPAFGFSKAVWAVSSRAWALEKIGAPRLVSVSNAENVRWVRAAERLILAACDDESLIGEIIEAVDGRPAGTLGDRELANLLVSKSIVDLTLQHTEPTGARTCIYCDRRGWIEAKFCWSCGEAQTG